MGRRKKPDSKVEVGNITGVSGQINIAGRDIGYTAEQVLNLLNQIAASFKPKEFDGRCPYKGLDYFGEKDADLFFGREQAVEDLVARVRESRTIFITGPSGSGKSSLVRAGLLPPLKQGTIPGSDCWLYATMKPGREPIAELARVAARLGNTTNAEDEICAQAMTDATIFARWCEIALGEKDDRRVVLFVDQFEEIFTQISREPERIAFLEMLTHAGAVENCRIILLFAMRSDFIANCAAYPKLNLILNRQFVQIGAMQPDELVNAIARPALHVGLRIDPDLIAQIINDMKGEPGALPLMQFALKDLFDSQQQKDSLIALTLEDYLHQGGIHKALERHADDSFSKLSENEQQLARSIFSSLIETGRGTPDTRRTAIFDELVPANINAEDIKAVVQRLADARLVITDEQADKQTVTISHEKLIDAWPWLKKLVNENREAIALQNEISQDAKEWDEHDRDPSFLYSGARLSLAQENLAVQRIYLSELAYEFISEGIKARNEEKIEKEKRRRTITTVLMAGITVALVLAGFALYQMLLAQKQVTISRSQTLAAQSQFQRSENPELSILLAIESFNTITDIPDSEKPRLSEQAVRDSLNQVGGIPLSLRGPTATIASCFAFSPDGHWLATGTGDGLARLQDMSDLNNQPIMLTGLTEGITALGFSPDSHWLAAAGSSIYLWHMNDPGEEPVVLSGQDTTSRFAFSPNGRWLATGGDNTNFRLWDLNNLNKEPIILRGGKAWAYTLAFSPDGHWLVMGGSDSTYLWSMNDIAKEPMILPNPEGSVDPLAFSPNSRWFAIVNGGNIDLWDLNDLTKKPDILHEHEEEAGTSAVAFSPNGRWLATGSSDATVRLWDMENLARAPTILRGGKTWINTLAFSPNGRWLATGGEDGVARLWDMNDITKDAIILRGHEKQIQTLGFSPNSQWLVTDDENCNQRLWSMNRLFIEPIVIHGHQDLITSLVFSPNGHWLATGSRDATVRLWDMNDLTKAPTILRSSESMSNVFVFSPNGHWLATANDSTVYLWEMNDLTKEPTILRNGESMINAVAFSSDGHWLAIDRRDGIPQIWDMNNLAGDPIILQTEQGSNNESSTGTNTFKSTTGLLAFSPNSRWLVTGGFFLPVRLWDLNNLVAKPILLCGPKNCGLNFVFSPNSMWLAQNNPSLTVNLWNMNNPTKEPIVLRRTLDNQSGHYLSIFTMAFNPSGRWLATSLGDTAVTLWDMNDLTKAPMTLRGHKSTIDVLTFSSNGRWLATGSEDSTVLLWNMNDLTAMPIILHGHEDMVEGLAFSPDGRWLATGSYDNTIRLWTLDINQVIKFACEVVGRNFIRAEWSQYFPGQPYPARQEDATCPQWSLEQIPPSENQ